MLMQELGRELLEENGYRVMVAGDGVEAVELFRRHHDEIALVILDLLMPKMNGARVFAILKEINPAVKVLLTSGYNYDEDAARLIDRGGEGFIQKPFGVKELAQKIREILDRK